jgi:hypothetical protein
MDLNHLEDGRIIFKWILNKQGGRFGARFILAQGQGRPTGTGSCEYGNEPLGSITGGEFADYLGDYYILKSSVMAVKYK